MSPNIGKGGLIHIVGGPGCGKTTTGSATVVSRLIEHGGMCTTIEDPDEMKLNGWHGKGYCSQHCIENWGEAMKRALRCQPSGAKLMMYVGEVRDTEAARTMLRAANNGFLVVSTGFGADIVSGIDDFQKRLPADERGQLANALRLIVYQHLDNETQTLHVEMLRSESSQSTVAAIIRSGNLNALLDEINYQKVNTSPFDM
jgi:twitching motility protein PilT